MLGLLTFVLWASIGAYGTWLFGRAKQYEAKPQRRPHFVDDSQARSSMWITHVSDVSKEQGNYWVQVPLRPWILFQVPFNMR